MAAVSFYSTSPSLVFFLQKKKLAKSSPSKLHISATRSPKTQRPNFCTICRDQSPIATLLGVSGLALINFVEPTFATELPLSVASAFHLTEPANALSLPTWVVHVSSVVEWVTAMALIWQYGEKSGNESWKGLAWGMLPLLGGAFCACTWHFFYNSETLDILVTIQAALTVIGNATMCIAAFRIFKSSQESLKN